MSLSDQLQGFTPEESKRRDDRLAEQPDQMVQARAQHELGLSEHRFPNHWKSALSAAISTAVGAFIPIIPFFFMSGVEAVIASFVVSIVAHFMVGAVKSLITIRSWWASGFEMTLVGVIEAVVTYGLGLAFGAGASVKRPCTFLPFLSLPPGLVVSGGAAKVSPHATNQRLG